MKSMTVPVSKEECCGCTACVSVCPTAAITMKADEEGFLYPFVDSAKCVECGLCRKKCAFANNIKVEKDINTAYLVKHRNDAVRSNSRSGGVFVAFSDWVLNNNGSVYGCVLNDNLYAEHIRAESSQVRDKMCKSKYVQSDMSGVIPQIIQDLSDGKRVLFSGTGCQADGLLAALSAKNIDCSNLYTIDIICHGAPSPMIFEQYIAYLEKRKRGKVTSFDFRDKEHCGWAEHIESAVLNGKKHYGAAYTQIFHTDLCLRQSCYNCKYCVVGRKSDITIGDAWGVDSVKPEFNDNKGVSVCLLQSEKGKFLFNQIVEECDTADVPLKAMIQPNLQRPSKPKGNREQFWKDYKDGGIKCIVKKYGRLPLKRRIKMWINCKTYLIKDVIKHT